MNAAPAVRPHHPLPDGSTVAHYRITHCIGSGGMGIVYAAHDVKLRRPVALKFLSESTSADPQALRRFAREAEAASALNHANICTIYDIDETGDEPFIVMELLRGETLAQKCAVVPLDIRTALDVGIQLTEALAVAHEAGIVHRDVKPANVFVTTRGQVKVLDFGLAKIQPSPAASTAETTSVLTTSGTAVGTLPYMSPEQVKGREVDGRSDLFSLGAVLYRVVTGHSPFRGASAVEVCDAILHAMPPPPTRLNPDVPPELERIIVKALEKDPDLRYQHARDLGADLNRLRRETLAREQRPGPTDERPRQRPTARGWRVAAVVAALVCAAASFLLLRPRTGPQLSERDTIVLADFDNRTGDAVFDETLKQALAADVQQSPVLNVLSDQRVRTYLQLMGRKPDERLNEDTARDMCQRAGSKAVLAGSIATLGTHYILGLNAINCSTGDSLGREEREVNRKEGVLGALDNATSALRGRLGESLASIRAFDKPIEDVTTPSLEALRAFSLGIRARWQQTDVEAIPLLQHAIELDPDFAWAYLHLAVSHFNVGEAEKAAQYTARAYALRDRTSEREKCTILAQYYLLVTGELDKEVAVSEGCARTYPGYYVPPLILGLTYSNFGRFEQALAATQQAIRLEPTNGNLYANLMGNLAALKRIDEAKAMYRQAVERKVDNWAVHVERYMLAISDGDSAELQRQTAWAEGKPGVEDQFVVFQSLVQASSGHLDEARALSQRAVASATRSGRRETAGEWLAATALWEAEFGLRAEATTTAEAALQLSATRDVEIPVALALARSGQAAEAERLTDRLARAYPANTMLNAYWLPTIRAAIALDKRDAARAIEILRSVEPYDMAEPSPYVAHLYPMYLRGEAHLRHGDNAEALAQFQKLLDHRSIAPTSSLVPLARAAEVGVYKAEGQTEQARRACTAALSWWRQADRHVPVIDRVEEDCRALK